MKPLRRSLFFAVLFLILAFGSTAASAKDVWLNVKSENFNLYGNASEKEIRRAATKLEQFRETFRLVFASTKLETAVPTNVIVFKSNSYYKEFKPKRADGKTDNFVAGFFQPGEDVNYITLSMDGDDTETFKTIFHEYVHSILNANFSRITIPPWFNEGLAEYYSTFQIRDNRVASLGLPLSEHLEMLSRGELMPLESLFAVSGYGLLQMPEGPRSVFYAESWALIHYLVQTGKTDGLNKFLTSINNGEDAKASFEKAFLMDYKQMEKELRKYARSGTFKYHSISFKNELTFDTDMAVTPIDEGDANAILGDLLYHNNRVEDAEPYLAKALAAHPESTVANTAMGMSRFRAGKYDEAGAFLEKVVSENSNYHFVCYLYALVLTKPAADGARSVSEDTAKKAVGLLKRSIELDPKFFASYDLLAYVSLTSGVARDEAADAVSAALKLRPNDPALMLRLAELYARMDKVAEAGRIAAKAESLSDDPQIRNRAANLREFAETMARNQAMQDEAASYTGAVIDDSGGLEQMTPEELKEANETPRIYSINQSLGPLKEGTNRVLGYITKITCPNGTVSYSVSADGETFTLTSKDFQGLELQIYGGNGASQVGCDADLSSSKAVLTYTPAKTRSGRSRGELLAIDFVPDFFRLMTEDEVARAEAQKAEEEAADAARRRELWPSTRTLKPTEKRVSGTIKTLECVGNAPIIKMLVDGRVLSLLWLPQQRLNLVTAGARPPRMECGMESWKAPVTVIYEDKPNATLKTDGILVAVELGSADAGADQ